MPNIGVHELVSSSICDDHRVILGSTLPDLAGMYTDHTGTAVDLDSIGSRAFRYGLRLHHTTDHAFSESVIKSVVIRDTLSDFEANGGDKVFSRFTKRVYTFVAADILIEAVLMAIPFYRDKLVYYSRVFEKEAALLLTPEINNEQFTSLVSRYYGRFSPEMYTDPFALASMLQKRVLGRSQRTGKHSHVITDEEVEPAAVVLALQADRLKPLAQAILQETIGLTRQRFYGNQTEQKSRPHKAKLDYSTGAWVW